MAALGEGVHLSIPFRWCVYVIAGLPLTALILCITVALLLHPEESTSTHCGVYNWLPSISAAVASFSPERYIWRFFIGLHSAPRFALAFAYRNLLLNSPMREYWTTQGWFPITCNVACLINLGENAFLLLLTSISSTEDHSLHKFSFSGFALCAIAYMFVATALYHFSGCRRTSTVGEKSYQYKVLMCLASALSLLAAVYFFYRHNRYCEPGVYTFFAASEYILVLSNIGFHCTAFFDFHGQRLTLSSSGTTYQLLPVYESNKRSI